MSRPVAAFLDEVDEFLNQEFLPDAYTETSYFDTIETRVNYDQELVRIRYLSYCEQSEDGEYRRVNDVLDGAALRLEFQFHGSEVSGSWTAALAQFTVAFDVLEVDPPATLKWEQQTDTGGVLKADEWYDDDRAIVERDISAETALERALWEHLETTIPDHRSLSDSYPLSPTMLKIRFNDEHEILGGLDPVSTE